MKYAGTVFAGDLFVGSVYADSLSVLKQKASKLCNKHFCSIDAMVLLRANDEDINDLGFTRINRLYPNNTIVRGQWK